MSSISAFEKLVERHRDSVYGFSLRMTRFETEALEIAQESFLSAYLHLGQFRSERDFRAWLHQTAASHALYRLRRVGIAPLANETQTPARSNERSLAHCPGDKGRDVIDGKVLDAELNRAVENAIDSLPQGHREVLLFRDIAGLGYEEIANMSGSSIPAIKRRLHEARLCLRATIERFGSQVLTAT